MTYRIAIMGVLTMCASAWAEAPTGWSVELAASGSNKILVIKALRAATGMGLQEAKDLLEAAPRMVVENREQSDAERVAKQLLDAGATVRVVDASGAQRTIAPDPSQWGYSVTLTAIGPNKLAVIKLVYEATGLGLKETKDLVEAAPITVKAAISKAKAEALVSKLTGAGAAATAVGTR